MTSRAVAMVKAYQRYSLAENGTLGTIASSGCPNVLWIDGSGSGGGTLALTASLDALILWNLRTGTAVATMRDTENEAEVSSLTADSSGRLVASGYHDGKVRLWDRASWTLRVALDGHRSAIASVAFSIDGQLLASGSHDTDIIVWDCVAESGMFRLRGHKDAVTAVCFLPGEGSGRLVSGSKDSLIKVWELDAQHCVQTITGHRSEVWSIAADIGAQRVVSGGADAELRVWSLKPTGGPDGAGADTEPLSFVGSLPRSGRGRIGGLSFCGGGRFLLCQTIDKNVQVFRLRPREEAVRRMKRRLKRAKDAAGGEDAQADDDDAKKAASVPTAVDEMQAISIFSASAKVRAAAALVVTPKGGVAGAAKGDSAEASERLRVLCALHNNAIEVWEVGAVRDAVDASLSVNLYGPGHRSDVRAVAISSDASVVATCAGGEAKVWNVGSGQCFRTVPSGYGVCCGFVGGDKHVVIGTKTGQLQLLDVASAEMLEDISAHEGAVWSLSMNPDEKGFVSAGADKELKFWEFGALRHESGPVRLGMAVKSSVTMEDDVLAVTYSPDGKLLAVALLDTTVKIFFTDSMKFFLSLYGHRLPALAIDISTDGTLLVSGSADKNVKIWGLDFGDCHKSMMAHDDNIMAVKFVPRTHYFFSAGKDKKIKMWDADKFQHITTIKAHYSEVWCLAMSKSGDVLVSGSHDRSARVWTRTEEHIYLEEERQKELDELLDSTDAHAPALGEAAAGIDDESAGVSKQTRSVLDSADKLMEALDLCAQYPEKPTLIQAAMLLNLTPNLYFRKVLRDIRSHELESALVQLPFDFVLAILSRIEKCMAHDDAQSDVELLTRTAVYLVRLHHGRLAASQEAMSLLRSLRVSSKRSLQQRCDCTGYNLAALRAVKRRLEAAQGIEDGEER